MLFSYENNMGHLQQQLPPELWDQILTELIKMDFKQAIRYKLISKYFTKLILYNREMKYNLLLLHSDKSFKKPVEQFIWVCGTGEDETYLGYSKFFRIDVIKWAIDRLKITRGDIRKIYLLHYICKKGYLNVLKFLINTFKLNKHDIEKHTGFAPYTDIIEVACKKGHLHIIQYLLTELNLFYHGAEDYKNGCYLFKRAYKKII